MSRKSRRTAASNVATVVQPDYTYLFARISDQVDTHIDITEYVGEMGVSAAAHVLNILMLSTLTSIKSHSDQFITEETKKVLDDEKVEVAGEEFLSEFTICDDKGAIDDRALGQLHELMMTFHLSKLDELHAIISEINDPSVADELLKARQDVVHGQAAIAQYKAALS